MTRKVLLVIGLMMATVLIFIKERMMFISKTKKHTELCILQNPTVANFSTVQEDSLRGWNESKTCCIMCAWKVKPNE